MIGPILFLVVLVLNLDDESLPKGVQLGGERRDDIRNSLRPRDLPLVIHRRCLEYLEEFHRRDGLEFGVEIRPARTLRASRMDEMLRDKAPRL